MDRRRGIVTLVFPRKAYGFIESSDEEEFFFHFSVCKGRRPEPGDPVEFTPMQMRDGRWRAVKVKVSDVG